MATVALLAAGLAANQRAALLAAAVLSAVQVMHFGWRDRSLMTLTVQVRISYTAILVLALWGAADPLVGLLAIGALAQVMFDYCLLAPTLSLLP